MYTQYLHYSPPDLTFPLSNRWILPFSGRRSAIQGKSEAKEVKPQKTKDPSSAEMKEPADRGTAETTEGGSHEDKRKQEGNNTYVSIFGGGEREREREKERERER